MSFLLMAITALILSCPIMGSEMIGREINVDKDFPVISNTRPLKRLTLSPEGDMTVKVLEKRNDMLLLEVTRNGIVDKSR